MSKYMAEALALAKLAIGRTSPNPMVGAVVVKEGQIIGRGYHHKAGTPHAEVHALAEAGDRARGSTIYVTLEPCSHYGRTPPCSEALIRAGIKEAVIAMEDPNPLVAGNGIRQLRAAGIKVSVGDMEQEARKLNEVFIKYITANLPFVVFKTAMSIDGKIATSGGDSRWITGSATREWVHGLRDKYDAIMVGINTILTDDPLLTCRLPQGKDPIRLVVDSKLRIPLSAKIINSSTSPLIIATTSEASQERLRELRNKGIQVLVYNSSSVPLRQFLSDLAKRGISSILLEGGSTLGWSMLKAGLIDKAHFCIAPIVIGGTNAPGPLGGDGYLKLSDTAALDDLEVTKMGSDYVFTGYIVSRK